MKVLVFLIILLSPFAILNAQDAATSAADIQAQPKGTPPEAPDVPPAPSAIPQLPELSKLDEAFKQTSIGKAADDYRARVEIRALQNRITSDPDVVAARKNAEAAHTDLEKRERLRVYYQLSYGRMLRSASSENTRKALETEEAAHLKMLDQPRVRPAPGGTIPPVEVKSKAEKRKKPKLGRVTGS